MYKYNLIEKNLHKLVLSSRLIRETTFDIEKLLFPSRAINNNYVFITGVARSGTTILLNSIYRSDLYASLTYSDMPFILAPNLWSKISIKTNNSIMKERMHGDGIEFNINSPEAFEEVFWKTFNEKNLDSFEKFSIFTNNVMNKYNKKRYLSKNNQNIKRVSIISNHFPLSKILITFRDPIQQAFSLLTQHKKFINLEKKDSFISKYMLLIGHTEFGYNYTPLIKRNLIFKNVLDINHWIEQWYLVYKRCFENYSNTKNINFICYEKLCSSRNYWLDILDSLDIQNIYEFKFKNSYKEINLDIDKQIIRKAKNVYYELSKLNLKL